MSGKLLPDQDLEAILEAIDEEIWDKDDQFTAGVDCLTCELEAKPIKRKI